MPRPSNPDVKDRLRRAGGELVHQTAFGTTGVQDITAAAGVPKGSFYNYFDSKDAYAVELLDGYWRFIDDTYGPILRDPALAPLDAVKAFFSGLVAFHAGREYLPGCLMGNLALELSTTNPLARDKLRQLFSHWTAGLMARIKEARADARDHAAAEEIAAALIDAFEGAVLRAKVEGRGAALERFQRLVLPALLR